jgi:hypothetical protein
MAQPMIWNKREKTLHHKALVRAILGSAKNDMDWRKRRQQAGLELELRHTSNLPQTFARYWGVPVEQVKPDLPHFNHPDITLHQLYLILRGHPVHKLTFPIIDCRKDEIARELFQKETVDVTSDCTRSYIYNHFFYSPTRCRNCRKEECIGQIQVSEPSTWVNTPNNGN